jgi:hypothetical protein
MADAGWNVEWVADDPFMKGYATDGRWLGALARSASIVVSDADDARRRLTEWETLTGQSRFSEGCDCCGRPHYFDVEDDNGKAVHL